MRPSSKFGAPFAPLHRAFTLIELLVVMGIVCVLSTILFSVFGAVRKRSQQTTCLSNLKQLGKAFELYAQDRGGFYPPATPYVGASGNECTWGERIYPYVKSTEVFQCPSHPRGEFRTGCQPAVSGSDANSTLTFQGSYAMNMMDRTTPMHQARLRNPGGSVFLAGNGDLASSSIAPGWQPINGPDDLELRGLVFRHGAGDNLLFADGHVKWMSLEQMAQKGRDLWLPKGAS